MVIFGPMDQVGWARASAMVALSSRSVRPAPERPARRGQEQSGHRGRVGRGRQALMHGAVLGVDRHDLGPGRAARLLHDGRPGNERFLVGQRQSPPGLQGGHRHRKPGEADHGIEHHVGTGGGGHQALVPDHDLGPGRDAVTDQRIEGRIPDDHQRRVEQGGLSQQQLGRALGGQGGHPEAPRRTLQDVDGLGPDRAGRSQHADGAHQFIRGAWP